LLGGSGTTDASGSYVTSDGYVFSPYDVIQDLGDEFIVPHGNHFILFQNLTFLLQSYKLR